MRNMLLLGVVLFALNAFSLNHPLPSVDAPVNQATSIGFTNYMGVSDVFDINNKILDIEIEKSKKYLSERVGVEVEALENFYASINEDVSQDKGLNCPKYIKDSVKARTAFVQCLADAGRDSLNEENFGNIFEEKLYRIKNSNSESDIEIAKTIALLSWMEDMVRMNLKESGAPADMYRIENGFGVHSSQSIFDYDFQNGDIVLVIGTSSISALIPQVTNPQRRHSHAFIIEKDKGGKKYILESLIETGVVETSFEEFTTHILPHVIVLRLKKNIVFEDMVVPKEVREEIITEAVRNAREYVKKKTPYDGDMNIIDDDEKMFCSELVAVSYANAVSTILGRKVPIQDLTPDFAKIRSENIKKFISNFGVAKDEMPSPGDLIGSEYLEVVADWRDTSRLNKFWVDFMAGDVIAAKVDSGYEFIPKRSWYDFALENLPVLEIFQAFKKYLTKGVLNLELGVIPLVLNADQLAFMIHYDKDLYQPLVESFWKYNEDVSILKTPLWEIRGTMTKKLEHDGEMSDYFVPIDMPESQKLKIRKSRKKTMHKINDGKKDPFKLN